jgi:hypothetical protein
MLKQHMTEQWKAMQTRQTMKQPLTANEEVSLVDTQTSSLKEYDTEMT